MSTFFQYLFNIRPAALLAVFSLLFFAGTAFPQDNSKQLTIESERSALSQLGGPAKKELRDNYSPADYEEFLRKERNGEILRQSGVVPSSGTADVLVNNNTGATGTGNFTQSETSILAFGSNVVIGFNDAGSFTGGASKFTGFSYSTDGGASFTDGGTLPTNAIGDAGDPVLARDETTGRIYFSTLGFNGASTIQMFRSDDNGVTWMTPVNATPGGSTEDKQWHAVDNFAGTGNGNVYLISRSFGAPNGVFMYRSTNNGDSFGPTNGVLIASGAGGNVQGAFVAVGPDHSVYAFFFDDVNNAIKVRKSTDQGLSFAAAVTIVSGLVGGTNGDHGLTGTRQGTVSASGFRSNQFPHVAINPVSGNIYVTHSNNPPGTDKADVYFVQSTDGGTTWSAPITVNDDGTTTDQWQPTIGVTPDGTRVGIFYSSREEDPVNNNLFKHYGRIGIISGATVTFTDGFAVSDVASLPEFGRDNVINSVYMGDYDHVAATSGFFHVVWSDNRDNLAGGGDRKDPNVYYRPVSSSGLLPGIATRFVSAEVGVGGGNGNGLIDANECNDIFVTLTNYGDQLSNGTSATLSTSTSGVSVFQSTSSYPDIPSLGSSTNTTAFQITTLPNFLCGSIISFSLVVNHAGGSDTVYFSLPSNANVGAAVPFSNTTPTAIVDNATINIPILVSGFTDAIGKVTLSLYLTHTWDEDLDIYLIAPDNTIVELSTDNGGNGDNYGSSCGTGTIFDDDAAASIAGSAAPFVGTFRPEGSLASFNGKSGAQVNGTWTLRITDDVSQDAGTFQCATISIASAVCIDGGGGCGAPTASDAPVVNSPITSGSTSVSGTSTEADGTVIDVFVNSSSVVTTTVTGGAWTTSGSVTANGGLVLVAGDTVKATATASGETESPFSNEVVVQDVTVAPVVNSPITAGATSVSGTGPETVIATKTKGEEGFPVGGTVITVYVNSDSVGVTNVTPGGSWTLSGMTALAAGDTVKATATAPDKLTSAFSNEVIVDGALGTSDAPVVNSPIPSGSTSVSGTSTEADGTVIDVFVNSFSIGTTSITGGAWTKGGLVAANSISGVGLAVGDTVKATATASGETESPFSNEVIVQDVTVAPVVNSPITAGATSVSGTGPETVLAAKTKGANGFPVGGTLITVYVNSDSVGVTSVDGGGTWTKSGLAALAEGDTVKATATALNKLTSPFSNQVLVQDAPPPPSNVVTNPDFESGTGPWFYFTNGTGSYVQSVPGANGSGNAAKVTVTTTGSNVQFYQSGITLQAATEYRLKFKARSSNGRDVSAWVQRHDAPYSSYGLNGPVFDLTAAWQEFTVTFTTVNFPPPNPSNARLRFKLNGHAINGTIYYFDDVVLEQVVVAPPVATKINVETAADGSGGVVPAQSIETGNSITVYAISRTAGDVFVANVAATTWSLEDESGGVVDAHLVPNGDSKSAVFNATIAGTAKIKAVLGGLTPTTSEVITVIDPPPPATNLLVNGGFESGTGNWTFSTNGVGSLSLTPGIVGANAAQVSITTQGTTTQLYQKDITLTAGNSYRLSIKASCNTGHDMSLSIFKHTTPFTSYGLTSFVCDLTSGWQSYTVDFVASGFAGTVSDARLRIWLGVYDANGDVYRFDDVKLEELPIPPVVGGAVSAGTEATEIPTSFALEQNYPNPFNPATTIRFALPVDANVTLAVYNVLGQQVAELLSGQVTAGYHELPFDASSLASGIYVYRLTASANAETHFTEVRKLVLMK